jgi:diguanylate cyclase (GGDEF)-like protein
MFSILVVEEEGVITKCIEDHLGGEGYQAVMLLNGEDAVQFALRAIPSLIILDVVHSGYDPCCMIQHLRDHPKCMHVPIILVSSSGSLDEKVKAYELGVDVYLTRPLNLDELLAHTRRLLRRVQQISLSPLTRLPGGLQLERAIDYKLRNAEPWSVLYLDLDNFKAFNDSYGFLAGNDMILLVGHICQETVYEYGNADDFVGHVGGDDFVIVTTPEREKALCQHILERYNRESEAFYNQEDLKSRTIRGVNRKGWPACFPLVALSIGVVNDQYCRTQSNRVGEMASLTREVAFLTAEVKRQAKLSSNHISYGPSVEPIHQQYLLPEPAAQFLSDRFHSFGPSQSGGPTLPISYSQKATLNLRFYQPAKEDVLAEFS